jgi:biotin carboxylase
MSFERKKNGKTLLFIGGPADAVPALARAWALGYTVLVVDGDIGCPGIGWVDGMFKKECYPEFREKYQGSYSWAVADVYDPKAVLNTCLITPVDGVLAVATDVAPVVSTVARERGLPHVCEEVAALSWDKVALKSKLAKAGIPVPGRADFVVKPGKMGRGARGVTVVSVTQDAYTLRHPAITKAEEASDEPSVILERFVPGPQVSAEAVVWDGKVVFAGYTDRDYSNGFPVEAGGWGPSVHDMGFNKNNEDYCIMQRVVEAVDMRAGTLKLDIVMDSERGGLPTVIEGAFGRLSGGLMCSHYLPLVYGVDFLGAAFAVACGEDPGRFFEQWSHTRYLRGIYKNVKAKVHKERGRFFLGVGRTAAEAERKAVKVQERWRNDG